MLVATAIGLIGTIIAGMLLSEVVGVVGFLLSDRAVRSRFLPVVLGIGGAIAASIPDARARRTPS